MIIHNFFSTFCIAIVFVPFIFVFNVRCVQTKVVAVRVFVLL